MEVIIRMISQESQPLLREPDFVKTIGLISDTHVPVRAREIPRRVFEVFEKMDFILIEPGQDRRERQVSITEQGKRVLMEAIPLWEAAQAHIEQGLSGDRMGSLLKDLSEIIALSRNM